jgi:cytochrome P450
VFIRAGRAIQELLAQPEASEGWWPANVKQLLGSRSLANRNGADHRARRRVVGQLFSAAALRRYSPGIVALVDALAADLEAAPAPVPLVERLRLLARLGEVLERAREPAAHGLPLAGGLDLLSGGLDEAGLPLTDDDLVEQLLLLLSAGYETTASSLGCLLAAGRLKQLRLELAPGQDLSLQLVPSPSPRGGLLVTAAARAA